MEREPQRPIVFLHPTWELNGVTTVQSLLADGLAGRGWRCLASGTDLNQDPMPKPLRPERASIHRLVARPLPRKLLGTRRPAIWLARWLIGRRLERWLRSLPNPILVPGFDLAWTDLPPGLWRDIPVVSVIHSDDPWWYDYAAKVESRSQAVVAVSRRVGARLQEMFPARQVAAIPNGVPCPGQYPRSAGGARTGALRLLYAGRLAELQKRISRLPALCAALEAAGVAFELTIAGGGPDEPTLRQSMAPWVARQMARFLGPVPRPELLGLYARQDLFILLSDYEGTPMGLLEAMSAGCVPMVAQGLSGVEELVRDRVNGLVVPASEPAAQAARALELARDPGTWSGLSEAAWRSIRGGPWSLEAMLDSYIEVFEGLPLPGAAQPPPIRA